VPVSGWRYYKMGSCDCCKNADARLYVPVVDGKMEKFIEEGPETLRGPHLGHFVPICKKCTDKYSLDILCSTHKLPVALSDQRCQLCIR